MKTSYICPSSLVEILQLYFDGTLDNCDDYLDNLYKHTSELHPGNSLFGQITSDDMRYVLSKLDAVQRASVRYIMNRSKTSFNVLQAEYTLNQNQPIDNIDQWIWKVYCKAKDIISAEILKLI